MKKNRLLVFFLLSLLLHTGGLLFSGLLWVEDEEDPIFRARLAHRPRFTPPPRMPKPSYDLPQVDLEYAPVEAAPQQTGATAVSIPQSQQVEVEPVQAEPTELSGLPVPKAAAPQLARQDMPSPTAGSRRDTAATEGLDLLRIEDMARADARRAVVTPDLYSRRDISGYVNLTYLRMDGAGGFAMDGQSVNGKPVLEDIARYVRDKTQILAQMRPKFFNLFTDDELLEDPVHFLFPIERTAPMYPNKRIYWRPEEMALMEQYLRGGGFLFIDAGNSDDDRWFLKEMVALLRQALKGDGRLREVQAGHPVYHSFYDYPVGFPDERPKRPLPAAGNDWYYPDLPPLSKRLRGLWELQLDGRTAAIISDLDLHLKMAGVVTAADQQESQETSGDTTSAQARPVEPYLQAMTNILVYALTRPSGLAQMQDKPLWGPEAPVHANPLLDRVDPGPEWGEGDLLDALDATLALVHTPLGENIGSGGLGLAVNGGYRLDILAQEANGLMVRNLPAGPHWLRVEFAGKSEEVEIDLQGGKVTTVSFRMDRLVFFSRLSLHAQEEKVEVRDWQGRFGDLHIEEVFYEEELSPP
ncbi:MAG: DUF4159 domain-containing protein [Candidatus Latescibacteria bacterium]|nr:DUF4159 domain-containing protein [Candidatus Latescibacterota bacterium]